MSFSLAAMPTSGCSLEPTAVVGSSGRLFLFVSESVPDLIAGFLASLLSVLDASTLGSLKVKAIVLFPMVGTPGLGFLGTIGAFFFTPTGGFFRGPGPTFLAPGASLVVLKRKRLRTFGFLDNMGLVPSVAIFLLTRGLVLAVTEAAESLLGPSIPPTFTEPASLPCSLLPC